MNLTIKSKTPLTWLQHYEGVDRIPFERTPFAYETDNVSGGFRPNFSEAMTYPRIVYSVKDIQKLFGNESRATVRSMITKLVSIDNSFDEHFLFNRIAKPKNVSKRAV